MYSFQARTVFLVVVGGPVWRDQDLELHGGVRSARRRLVSAGCHPGVAGSIGSEWGEC